ncbi:MAG: dihydrolipoyl dehydrogenase [Elusimicrobia bacterium]|nr:dihydrolipoyl dehydrogenase [Elusimicrobiota bacterium]
MDYDIIVIGSGPGGYVAAIRAAQLGAKVAVVDKGEVGGVCLNCGCIPTKTLIATAELFSKIKNSKEFGINIENPKVDFPAVIDRKEKIIKKLQGGISSLFRSHKIEFIKGEAKITGQNKVEVNGKTIESSKIIIATGSSPMVLPGLVPDGKTILTSTDILINREIPQSLVIIGGGVIGIEFASLFNSLGVKVTIVEMLPRILINEDEEISTTMTRILAGKGVEIKTNSKVLKVEGNKLEIESAGVKSEINADKVLLCIGRKPNTAGLGLEKINIEVEKGFIKVNSRMETSAKNVYAVGDAAGKYLLAYTASAEGIVAAENATGKESEIDYRVIPSCIFSSPEIGSVGLTEAEAKKRGYLVKVGKFPLMASGRAVILNETKGLVKVIVDEKTDKILGVHIIGNEATELIHLPAMAIKLESTTKEFERICFGHPSLSETILEAVHDVHKQAIDLPKKN